MAKNVFVQNIRSDEDQKILTVMIYFNIFFADKNTEC